MEEIREIGVEKEAFLAEELSGYIKEPKKFGFPYDEMGFLVELRSLPSDRFYPVYTSLRNEQLQFSLRANKFNMKLWPIPSKLQDKHWVDDIAERYGVYETEDRTENIYNSDNYSHHYGILPCRIEGKKRLTSGVHIHFSSRRADNGEVIQLPIEKIVRQMDEEFEDTITRYHRNLGEWEPKEHGFEYRSLPCNADIYKVLKKSFKIIRSV